MLLSNSVIKLRAPEPEDLDLLYEWENDTELWEAGSTISPFSKYILREYIASVSEDIFQSRQLRLMIILKETDAPVGMIDLFEYDPFNRKSAMGILIASRYQKKGLGTMALELMEDYAFRFLGVNMLYVHIPVTNTGSLRLFEKNGFLSKGILSDWIRIGNTYRDVAILQKNK